MKIRKVDDKPMVIHTKEKAKIHAHEPKGAKIKGSNIYTVERGPKTAGAKVTNTDRKKSYRKSTIHQSESKNKGLSRFKRNYRESNTSIKTKNTNLHIAGRTGALAAGAVTEHVEGGQEVSQAAYLAYEASRPVTGTASKGAALFRKKAAAEAKKRIKKVDAGKKLAKKTAKKAAKDTAKTVAKETAKETAKTTAKVAAKTASKTAATAAGTAVAPGVGTAIGIAAGYAAGVSIEVKDEKMTNRSRKIKFFLDKMKAQENQTDSVAKLVKDLIVRKAITWVKAAAPIVGLVLLLLVLVVAMIAVPVIAAIAILYNSPFALFLPPLESGDTVQTVTSAYVQEFNRDVNTKVNEHTGYDLGELVYVDYEGMEENPSNYYDIMAVYMVKHGVGDTATVMNDTSKGWLQAVVNDMCSYTTSTGTKDVEETDADGNVTTVTKSVLYVNVTLKSYRDMISVYGFNSDQVEMLEQIMSPEFMGQLGYAGSGSGGGGGSPGVSSMTEDEINAILNEITDSRQKTVCSYALHRVGFPYSQDLRDSGNYYDCSSLAYYSWKDAGVDISYGGATTAAAEAQGLDEAGKACKDYGSGTVKVTGQDLYNLQPNNTNNNNTEYSDTYPILSGDEERMGYEAYLREQLEISVLKSRYPYDSDMIEGILELMLDILCSRRKMIRIAGDDKPANVVKGRFMKLDMGHIQYVMDCVRGNTTKVRSIKQYLLAALYNAPATMDGYYRAEVNHDMATGKI